MIYKTEPLSFCTTENVMSVVKTINQRYSLRGGDLNNLHGVFMAHDKFLTANAAYIFVGGT